MFDIRENLAKLPDQPGVYLHKDAYGEVIYVGKATSLRSRVRQYFAPPASLDAKTRALASHIAEFETIVTGTEAEALLLENTLIKKYRPQYNVMLRDDKTYPYIEVTLGETWPRLVKTRVLNAKGGSKYFGPYADVGAMNRILDLLNNAFRLKRCARETFPAEGWRPCLNGFIGGCDQCCLGAVDPAEYAGRVRRAMDFLRGRDRGLADELKARMAEAASRQDYEAAAKWRDLSRDAAIVTERQKVDLLSSGSMDILIAVAAEEGRMAQAILFFVRDGRLVGREIHHLDAGEGEEKREICAAFLKQYYANQTMVPKEILLEETVPDMAAIEAFLSREAEARVRLHVPERGEKHDLLLLAQKDVRESAELVKGLLAAREEREADAVGALLEFAGGSGGAPRIEAYDISHTGGRDSVGAMVVFHGAEKSRRDYRRFRIRTGADDSGADGIPGAPPTDVISGAPPTDVISGFADLSRFAPANRWKVPCEGHSASARGALPLTRNPCSNQKADAQHPATTPGTPHRQTGNADDYAAMQEILYRRMKRGLAAEKGFDELPAVILVDGGLGHVHAAEEVLSAMGGAAADIPVLGMVKDDKHRTRGLVRSAGGAGDDGTELPLAGHPNLFHLIGAIQEEVHRFAIEYHRGVRGKRLTESELDRVPGIGPKRRQALLLKFGSLEGIKKATEEELAETPGMTRKAAQALREHLALGV
ncbi:MAG: excinuclease ABC subunit UvrC [Clostridiales Family XIII bacterium]|jgi:excinuclease ABC subunit C|nr:excinuclease ABC subunit UvrC [Clostridiales Family XIII bacterium]